MTAPWTAVPLPGGKPLPSGAMLMSQLARSASLTGCPRPGVSAASAVLAPSAKRTTAEKDLRVSMLRLPFAVDGPTRDGVHVPHREGDHRRIGLGLAPLGDELGPSGLHVASLVPGAALQDRRLAVPTPGHAEAGQGLAQHRLLQRRLGPALAPISRDHDLGDPAVARIGEARNFVEPRTLQGQARRRV